MGDCPFWASSKYNICKVMKYLKGCGPSYNWEHSKGDLVSEFLGIDIKKLDNVGFQIYQTILIHKVFEYTRM